MNVPIVDIPLWLLDRRKLCKDWGKKLRAVESKCEKTIEAISQKKNLEKTSAFIEAHRGSTNN